MRKFRKFHVLALGTLLVAPVGAGRATANGHFRGREVVGAPTAYVETVPTAYALPTAYTLPSAYTFPSAFIVPTTYVDTVSYVASNYVLSNAYAYVAPTTALVPATRTYVSRPVYAPSVYVVPSAYYAPTLYAPVPAVYPSAYETQVVSYAADPCATTAPAPVVRRSEGATAVPYQSSGSQTASPSSVGVERATPTATPKTVESVPVGRPSASAATAARDAASSAARDAASSAATTRETAPAPATGTTAVAPVEAGDPPSPASPAPEKETPPAPAATPLTTPEDKSAVKKIAPPVAPDGNPIGELPLPTEPETERRDARKPVLPRPPAFVRLEGKVVKGESGESEAGVRVTASNRLGTFTDREAVTDSLGRYAFRLPEGDWTVKVAMPSGRVYPVSELTVSNGQISDDQGRDIPTLTINR